MFKQLTSIHNKCAFHSLPPRAGLFLVCVTNRLVDINFLYSKVVHLSVGSGVIVVDLVARNVRGLTNVECALGRGSRPCRERIC